MLMGLARGRFCELLSTRLQSNSDLFLMGLLSIMDAVLEVSMEVLLAQIPVDHEIKAVLIGQNSPLRPLYKLMLAQESGEWSDSGALRQRIENDRRRSLLRLVAGPAMGTGSNSGPLGRLALM